MAWFARGLKQVRDDKRGSALIVVAFTMPALIGAGGLAVDTVQWTLTKRQMQRAADSSALAGAYALAQGKSADSSARADLTKSAETTYTLTPVVENAPTTGAYAGRSEAVRVVLTSSRTLPFSSLFLTNPPVIKAEATAAIITSGPHCLISLDESNEAGITLAGNATADLGCGVATNSRATNAIVAGGSSILRASPITAVGGITPSSSFTGGAKLEAYSLTQADPFKDLPNPVLPATCQSELKVGSNNVYSTILPPPAESQSVFCFRGMDIKGNLTLAPGTYYIDGGTLSVGAQGKISGTGVTIVLTSATAATQPSSIAQMDVNGGAELDLTAPDTGAYKGVLIYQDRRAGAGTNQINGNADSVLSGAMYFPKQDILYNGTAGMRTNCIQLVSRRITMSGNATITNECPVSPGGPDFTGSRVRLVG